MSEDKNKIFENDSTVYFIQKSDIGKCAKLMAKAFHDDPSIRYLLCGNGEGKNDWKYFNTLLKALFGKCVMISLDKDINEFAFLLPPSSKGVSTLSFILNGGIYLPFLFKRGLYKRSLKYEENCKRVRAKFQTEDTWYFMGLVVDPEKQHHGRGASLLKYILSNIKSADQQIYLETHKASNVEIYKHFGFELKDTTVIPDTTTLQYGMLCRPKGEQ